MSGKRACSTVVTSPCEFIAVGCLKFSVFLFYQNSDKTNMRVQFAHSSHARYSNATPWMSVILWLLLATSLRNIVKAGAVTM